MGEGEREEVNTKSEERKEEGREEIGEGRKENRLQKIVCLFGSARAAGNDGNVPLR